ncbi:hypothetical protein [Sporosarcina beigongshangi]|uniref:hypothetical protein n=1 Tax=Sporosarcina beigongshangi TaxID=2782538 RepID=UPI00193A04F8|nr:hypothetical protein [Sporosarcina beigongshangi]
MKRIIFSLLLVVVVLVSACQSKELLFVGEGERWSAKVTVGQTDGDETYTIQLSYKGDDVKTVETMSYAIKSSHDGVLEYEANEVLLNERGVYKGQMLSSNSPSTTSADELLLEVEWNGESEIFILRNGI